MNNAVFFSTAVHDLIIENNDTGSIIKESVNRFKNELKNRGYDSNEIKNEVGAVMRLFKKYNAIANEQLQKLNYKKVVENYDVDINAVKSLVLANVIAHLKHNMNNESFFKHAEALIDAENVIEKKNNKVVNTVEL